MLSPYRWHLPVWQQLWQQPDRLPHALLLHGMGGIGKRQFASALAARLLCTALTAEGFACGACASCHWLEQGSHPDFYWLAPESGEEAEAESSKPQKRKSVWITVDQVRELVQRTSLSKHQGGWRVVVVDTAEQLNLNAANALLKTLEEPSQHTLFLLLSSRLNRVMPTIRSRCLKLALPSPDFTVAREWLDEQGVSQAQDCLYEAGGAPLAALALAEPEYRENADRVLQALTKGVAMDPLALAEKCQDMAMSDFVDILQKWLYDLQQMQAAGSARFYPQYGELLQGLGKSVNLSRLLDMQELARRCRKTANHPLNNRLVQEELLINYQSLFRLG